MLRLVLTAATVMSMVGAQWDYENPMMPPLGTPEDCQPYLSPEPPQFDPQTSASEPIYISFDTRYLSMMNPQCESTLWQYYDSPKMSLPPIVISTVAPPANVDFPIRSTAPRSSIEEWYKRRSNASLDKRKEERHLGRKSMVPGEEGTSNNKRRLGGNYANSLHLGPFRLDLGGGFRLSTPWGDRMRQMREEQRQRGRGGGHGQANMEAEMFQQQQQQQQLQQQQIAAMQQTEQKRMEMQQLGTKPINMLGY